MADMDITQLPIASPLSISDLLYIAIPNALSPTGFSLCKVTSSELADYLLNQIQFATRLDTTHKTVFGAINEVAGKELPATLTAGSTSLTFTDSAIKADSLILVFAEGGLLYNSITTAVGSVVLTFDEQATDVAVTILVR